MVIPETEIITENSAELLEVVWDSERFALIHYTKPFPDLTRKVIILNPAEAQKFSDFIKSKEG